MALRQLTCWLVIVGGLAPAVSLETAAQSDEDRSFRGKIGYSSKESVPAWPKPLLAPEGAPNIVLIMLDDIGFGDASTFGGPAQTPNLSKLAEEGLRYNNFHTTGICSSTRAALLSGRNHHRVGFGTVGEHGFPGYLGIWKKSAATIAQVLHHSGYSTAAFGKWHNTPSWEITPIGPFDRWPTGLGFEYFFGDMRHNGSQWSPQVWRNTEQTTLSTADRGRHLTSIVTDEAVAWIRAHDKLAPQKPYFVYFTPEAVHTPHHVPPEWIEKYQGKFDSGWDELRKATFQRQKESGIIPSNTNLTERPAELPAWQTLSPEQKRLCARQMEVYAGFISHTDYELGRLLNAAQSGPRGENTLILYIVGDNGPEGIAGVNGTDDFLRQFGGQSHRTVQQQLKTMDRLGSDLHIDGAEGWNIYSTGWAWAGSTPFKWMKHVASHLGGTRNPLVVSWPQKIKDPGGIRRQFVHLNDVAATLYEAAQIKAPAVVDGVKQLALDGPGFFNTFVDANAPALHRVQYFEMEGSRAIYEDGWIASARYGVPWERLEAGEILVGGRRASASDLSAVPWELYDLRADFSQAHNVASEHREKLIHLKKLFESEARRNYVYPLDPGLGGGSGHPLRHQSAGDRQKGS